MPTVTDTFNRANNALTMGNADTGQTWAPWVGGSAPTWGIISNSAYNVDQIAGFGAVPSFVVIDAGMVNTIASVTILDGSAVGGLGLADQGLVFRWVDASNYYFMTYSSSLQQLRLFRVLAGFGGDVGADIGDPTVILADGDVFEVRTCGNAINAYLNGVHKIAYLDDGTGPMGTFYGLQTMAVDARFDDFSVIDNGDCGANWTVPPLVWSATATVETPPIPTAFTERFDAGDGSQWYCVPALSDSGDELRAKNMKAVYAIGRLTNASVMGYAYDVGEPINMADLEAGVRTNTKNISRPQSLPDSTEVTQTPRKPINIFGTMHTCRLEGDDRGKAVRDRIEQITYEVSRMGVRR